MLKSDIPIATEEYFRGSLTRSQLHENNMAKQVEQLAADGNSNPHSLSNSENQKVIFFLNTIAFNFTFPMLPR